MTLPSNTARATTRRRQSLRALAAIALTVLAACSEAPSAPLAPASKPSAGLLGGVVGLVDGLVTVLTSPLRAKALKRNSPIAAQSASATIGLVGGTITLPGAGLTVVVPSGAVSVPTTITVSAPQGTAVWYDFQPHGIKFAVPLQITQDLRSTNYSSLPLLSPPLKGAYMVDGSQDPTAATALVTETISATLDLLRTKVTFPVRHFSGYMVAWGFEDSTEAF
jgi:hypothetical protein